jgi:hypothetical protein
MLSDSDGKVALFGWVTIQATMLTTRASDTDAAARMADQLIQLDAPDLPAGGETHARGEDKGGGSGGGFEGTVFSSKTEQAACRPGTEMPSDGGDRFGTIVPRSPIS